MYLIRCLSWNAASIGNVSWSSSGAANQTTVGQSTSPPRSLQPEELTPNHSTQSGEVFSFFVVIISGDQHALAPSPCSLFLGTPVDNGVQAQFHTVLEKLASFHDPLYTREFTKKSRALIDFVACRRKPWWTVFSCLWWPWDYHRA